MKTRHTMVTLLDMPEILPFRMDGDVEDSYPQLFDFIDELVEAFDEEIYYIGQDNIGEKFYERFLFDGGGFLEIMMEPPAAVVAHFVSADRAEAFATVLKAYVEDIDDPAAGLMRDSIDVESEEERRLSYEEWEKLKDIRATVGE